MLSDQSNTNGGIPLEMNAVMVPSLPEPQDVLYKEKLTGFVVVITKGWVIVHPEASVTETVC
jgi:hypothetical protein